MLSELYGSANFIDMLIFAVVSICKLSERFGGEGGGYLLWYMIICQTLEHICILFPQVISHTCLLSSNLEKSKYIPTRRFYETSMQAKQRHIVSEASEDLSNQSLISNTPARETLPSKNASIYLGRKI